MMKTSLAVALVASLVGLGAVGACKSTVESPSGGGGGAQCSKFDTDPPASKVARVRFANKTQAPIFLGSNAPMGCGQDELFQVADAQGKQLSWSAGACAFTCAMIRKSSACGCAADCALPRILRIEPGGHFDETWTGLVFENATLPAACDPAGMGCGPDCIIWSEPKGPLTISGSAWKILACPMGTDCSCTPDSSGSCSIYAAGQGGLLSSELAAKVTVTSVADGTIELAYQ